MKKKHFLAVIAFLIISGCVAKGVVIGDWEIHQLPTDKKTQVYGAYASGCIDGAAKLPKEGVGYQLAFPENGRHFGHPSLIAFIKRYAKTLKNEHDIEIIVSDLGQARGGPAPLTSGHRSHQTGLDVDIWFRNQSRGTTLLTKTKASSMLDKNLQFVELGKWKPQHSKMLSIAANTKEVERVFVHPAIKRHLCKQNKGAQWLNKIRPWWGHHKHFHIRLKCPDDSKFCQRQSPVPNTNGCGASLDWWFSEEAKARASENAKKKRSFPSLPSQCQHVYDWQ